MLSKIMPEHQCRTAIVYVRQSTSFQIAHNLESQRRQYGLADYARQLGFGAVNVIDEDLGRTGSGLVERPGFQRLVGQICAGQIGAVFCIEASRLARNGRDWHHLIELCGLVGSLVIDPDGVYDPRILNDRLLLGLKGTMSEFELNILRQRSLESIRQKARRGELQFILPAGYSWTHHGKIEKDPDQRVQQAIEMVFLKFTELGSARQVLLWFRSEAVVLPVVGYDTFGRVLCWRLPVYRTIHSMLFNPIYAGAYAFGKTEARTRVVRGRAQKTDGHKKPRENWLVLIPDHHPGYVSWEEFERNQMVLQENAHSKSCFQRKSGRGGRSLLAGMIRCGHCGRMLHVAYSGSLGNVPRYHCRGANLNHGAAKCISFGGLRVDRKVSEELLAALSPSAIDAAVEEALRVSQQQDVQRQSLHLQLEQAQYEVRLATKRYESVDPENRLVARELEQRWNAALQHQRDLEKSLEQLETESAAAPIIDRQALARLADDLPAIWHADATDMKLKQRIVRLLIREFVATINDESREVLLVIHWMGGRHSELRFAVNRTGHHSRCTGADAINIIQQMAVSCSDRQIAATLNRLGMKTGAGNTWEEHRVRSARSHLRLPAHDPSKSAGTTLTMEQAAKRLGIATRTMRRLVEEKIVPATQVVATAPWEIPEASLSSAGVIEEVRRIRSGRKAPRALASENQESMFSMMWPGGAE
jgi:DNA invertase Pin-like site-specific DNA recombinase